MAHSPHKRFSGCCLLCALWIRGENKRRKMSKGDLNRAGGDRAIKYKRFE